MGLLQLETFIQDVDPAHPASYSLLLSLNHSASKIFRLSSAEKCRFFACFGVSPPCLAE
jgi:hypothetical protein